MIYLTFIVPLANISPIFALWPYFPFEMLNDSINLRIVPNADAFNIVGNNVSGSGAKFVNFELKM